MHTLHGILVYLPCVDDSGKRPDADAVRRYAENVTECFYPDVFDYRETDSAGRFSFEYPANVIYSADDMPTVIRIIRNARQSQKSEVELYQKYLEKELEMHNMSLDISCRKLIRLLWRKSAPHRYESFLVSSIAEILAGHYVFESFFYDTSDYTSIISDDTFRKIAKEPDNWAIVLMDLHN